MEGRISTGKPRRDLGKRLTAALEQANPKGQRVIWRVNGEAIATGTVVERRYSAQDREDQVLVKWDSRLMFSDWTPVAGLEFIGHEPPNDVS